ncbi:hypothetical protein [Aeromonas dhakensis]|uniref:hypothetical protein n=1 Tax=Aeromonas dhakensis TaxID=196024 RepID=UPI0039B76D6C
MGWTVDDSNQRILYDKGKHVYVPPAAMAKYYAWKDAIKKGQHPINAVTSDMNYEELLGIYKGIYTIRLSQGHRVAFEIYDTLKQVKIISIGGHFPPSKK